MISINFQHDAEAGQGALFRYNELVVCSGGSVRQKREFTGPPGRPGEVKRADTLIKRIKEKNQAAEWRWLMEKAEELKLRRS